LKGQNQSGSGGAGQGDKKEDKVCKHVYVKQILKNYQTQPGA
jgi:hypothetical protein